MSQYKTVDSGGPIYRAIIALNLGHINDAISILEDEYKRTWEACLE